jgi:hypothetical protein
VLQLGSLDKVFTLTTFREESEQNPQLAYWLTRTPEQRIAEVERLRREYLQGLGGADRNGCPEGLCRSLLLIERSGR